MTAIQDIGRLIPTAQSLAILGNVLPKKKGKTKLVKTGMETIVGVSLMTETAKLTGGL